MAALHDIVNKWRVVPRLLMFVYMVLLVWVSQWFMGLDAPNGAQGTFAGVVWGAGAAWFGIYINGKPQ